MFGRFVQAALLAVILSGCGPAAAATPDSDNPAHCIAAFNHAAYWFNIGKRPEKVTAMVARAMYEMEKLKASGASMSAAKAEGKALTEAYAGDEKTMDALFLACGSAQDTDPRFRAELPRLVAAARNAPAPYHGR